MDLPLKNGKGRVGKKGSKRMPVEPDDLGTTQLYFGQMEEFSLLSAGEELALGKKIRDGQDKILRLAAREAEYWPGFKHLEHLTADWRSIERTSHASIEWLLAEVEVTAWRADKRIITLKTTCRNQSDKDVLTGQAVLMVSS